METPSLVVTIGTNGFVRWLFEEFKKEQGIDLSQDRQAVQRLREAAEKAKIELSSTPQTERSTCPLSPADSSGPKTFADDAYSQPI